MRAFVRHLLLAPRLGALWAIRVYQRLLSPDHGVYRVLFPRGYCRFHPSCSQYAHEAIARHGLIRGGSMAAWRVLRCNPLSKGGIDPVPERCEKSVKQGNDRAV